MPDKEIMVQIRELEGQLGWRAWPLIEIPGDTVSALEPGAFADALAQLAGDWRMLADLYDKAKGKGFKTAHVDPLRAAARKLDEVVDQLRKPRRAPLGQLQGGPAVPLAPHRFERGMDSRTCATLIESGNEVDGSELNSCGQLPGAAVHNLAATTTARTGTVPPVESLDALIADSVARHRALDAEGVPDFRGPGDLADPNVGRVRVELGDEDVTAQVIDGGTLAPELIVTKMTVPAAAILSPEQIEEMQANAPAVQAFWNGVRERLEAAPEPTFPGQVTDTDVAAYLSGALDDLPADFGPPLAPSTVTDLTEQEEPLSDAPPANYQEQRALLDASLNNIPPVPLLGQPGDAGAGYAPTYVPPGGVPATFAELMTPVPLAALPAHISHSQIGTVGECPAKYRLTRIGRGPSVEAHQGNTLLQIPEWANIGGTVFHAVVEEIERSGVIDRVPQTIWDHYFAIEVAKVEASSPVPRSRWRASKQGAEGETWWNANGPEMVKRYLAARPSEPTASFSIGPNSPSMEPAIEIERTVEVPTPYGPIDYRAIIDRVTVRGGESASFPTLVIRDYKAGATMPSDTQQLGEYANVLRLLGVPPQVKIVGTYFNARKGVWTPEVDLEAEGGGGWTAEWFVYHITTGHAQRLALTTGPTPARPSSFCGGCPVRWACPIKGVKTGGSR